MTGQNLLLVSRKRSSSSRHFLDIEPGVEEGVRLYCKEDLIFKFIES
jgi:hypothetical protein